MKLNRFKNFNENLQEFDLYDEKLFTKIGDLIEEKFKKINSYFDYHYIEMENSVEYLFYFNRITDIKGFMEILNELKEEPNYENLSLISGRHDDSNVDHIVLDFIISKNNLKR